jgi:hypothetical protein
MKYATAKIHFEAFCKDHKADLKWENMPDTIRNMWYKYAEYQQWTKESLSKSD